MVKLQQVENSIPVLVQVVDMPAVLSAEKQKGPSAEVLIKIQVSLAFHGRVATPFHLNQWSTCAVSCNIAIL